MKLNKGILIILMGSSLFFTACKCDKSTPVATATTTEQIEVEEPEVVSRIDADGNYIYDLGQPNEIKLPNGTSLSVGEKSSENRLFTMLNDANFTVSEDKTQGWVTLDRVYFPTGKAALTETSQTQIANLVHLLKAFPTASVKVGGYTDNTGDATVNKQVSTDRAKTVADQIIAGGIEANRIESEGYGAEHFVCEANDTDECKAQNRRVDIRITKK
jgi:outer membrane protein OmpA-like peptidoglycan-associated protein